MTLSRKQLDAASLATSCAVDGCMPIEAHFSAVTTEVHRVVSVSRDSVYATEGATDRPFHAAHAGLRHHAGPVKENA